MSTVVIDLKDLPKATLTTVPGGYHAKIEILGISPKRGRSAEEILGGAISLNPPEVFGKSTHQTIRRAINTTIAAVDATNGSISPMEIAKISYMVDFVLRNAFERMGVEA